MNEALKEMMMIGASYIAIILIGFALMNFLTGGFLIKFLRVKASNGKRVLVKVKGVTDHYYKTGKISEKALTYRARAQKEDKIITIPDGNVLYRSMKVWCIDVDEDTNQVILPSGELSDTYDAEKYDQLITRAMYKPSLMDKNEKIMLLMIGAVILGVVIIIFYTKTMDKNVTTLLTQVSELNKMVSTSGVGVVS